MQANSAEHQLFNSSNPMIVNPGLMDSSTPSHDEAVLEHEPTYFHGYYESCMEMFADAKTVSEYLDLHREWFRRCAHPMKADPLGENGYALTIGQFGSFGYEVEPKIGLDLLPQDHGVYRIQTIPIPDYEAPGYEVDFQAELSLAEVELDPTLYHVVGGDRSANLPSTLTRVEWNLQLEVAIQFPRFIHALPKSLVQTTGDRLLHEIVRQVSRCLTHKVQQDFHTTRSLTFAKRRKKFPWNRGHGDLHSDQE